jgi:uncharacterized membrane protein YsdA (DUF1294 family)
MQAAYLISLVLLAWNALLFILVSVDKSRAKRSLGRIPERFFFWSAFLMGAAGIWGGMYFFRHKTRKWQFYLFVPLFFILNVAIIWFSYT